MGGGIKYKCPKILALRSSSRVPAPKTFVGQERVTNSLRTSAWEASLIQVGNRKDHFRSASAYHSRGVRLIKVSFKVSKGNKFGDFGYCPLNRRCPLNTGFTVCL